MNVVTPRRRLTPEQRRDELLDIGEQVFRTRPFEDTSMEDIAAAAGVTRALLYHYFTTKAEFFGAIWSRAHERLRVAENTSPGDTIRDRILQSLASYLEFYAENLPLVVIANRSSISREPAVRAPIDQTFALMCTTILDAAHARGHERLLAEAAFAGWIAFVRETTLTAYLDQKISPLDNHALCAAAFDATVGAHADVFRPLS